METIEMINLFLVLCLGTLYPYVNGKISMLEEKIREEMAEEIENVSIEVQETINGIGNQIKEVGKFDPEDQFQMVKLNLFQHFSNLAVDFIGKKLGGQMGVHQIGAPEAPHDAPDPNMAIIDEESL